MHELLKPRYKVIADYPDSKFEVGEILQITNDDFPNFLQTRRKSNNEGRFEAVIYKYPHLFRKLEWWEERDEKDMPEYLKRSINSNARKVIKWDGVNMNGTPLFTFDFRGTTQIGVASEFIPCTRAEYEEQQKETV